MFKIKNATADEHKRVRLIPVAGTEVSSVDQNIVQQDNGDLTFCLAPDTANDPSNILGIALGLGLNKRSGAILVKNDLNVEDTDLFVNIANKLNPEMVSRGRVATIAPIPETDQKIIIFNADEMLVESVEVETWNVALVMPDQDIEIQSEWVGLWNAGSEPCHITVYAENEVDVLESYLSLQVADEHLLPEAEYGNGYYLSQTSPGAGVNVLLPVGEESLPRLMQTYNVADDSYGSVSIMGRIWGDRRDGEVWESLFGFNAVIFGKVNGQHTGIFQGRYVW